MNESTAAEQQLFLHHLPLNADLNATRLGAAWRCLQTSTLPAALLAGFAVLVVTPCSSCSACSRRRWQQVAAGSSRWQCTRPPHHTSLFILIISCSISIYIFRIYKIWMRLITNSAIAKTSLLSL